MNIRLQNVVKRFGPTTAVDRLTLEAQDGEMLVLLGPSGCGKSTTLRLVAGLEDVSEGAIFVGEREVNHLPPQARDVAMVFQNYALYPHMTVAENIAYPLRVRRKPAAEITGEVQRVAALLGLEALLERRPRALSGGERQRVALARAIVRHPAAFLMDEPLSNLDANLRLQMRGELKRLQQQLGTTTLYVTHDHAEAMTLAHRIAVLRDGRLQQLGTPMELYRRPANRFVAGFLGSPPMNFLAGTVESGAFCCGLGRLPLTAEQRQAAASARGVVLGFRPQAAALTPPEAGKELRAAVYVTEEMGSESVVVLSCGEEKITVVAPPGARAATGEAVGVRIASADIHLFDSESGKTLVSGDE
jgi:multiple sugar transport system ATP-binding protein